VPVRRVRGRFDSAATTEDNRRHWANADALSADAAASAAVRRTLRNRARYEVANNSYARGIVLTLANDTIGTGPRLQMLTDSDEANDEIEHEFDRWAHEIALAEKLRTMRMARAQDGEAFGILVNNPVLDHAVKLDLRLIEADQVASQRSWTSDWPNKSALMRARTACALPKKGKHRAPLRTCRLNRRGPRPKGGRQKAGAAHLSHPLRDWHQRDKSLAVQPRASGQKTAFDPGDGLPDRCISGRLVLHFRLNQDTLGALE